MSIETFSCFVSVSALIASFCSPIFVTLINNRFQSRKDERLFYDHHRCEVIERYLQCTARRLYDSTPCSPAAADYGASLAEIYMYTPQSLWQSIDEMNNAINELSSSSEYASKMRKLDDATALYLDLCKKFSRLSRSPKDRNAQRRYK